MTLVAGSYERFLFGYSYTAAREGSPAQLTRRFTHAAHKGVVKCLAAAGQYVASGGADDLIHLYDLKNDKDLSFLMNPGEGAITALEFFVPEGAYSPTHLLSGSADGSVSVWSVGGGWECMKTMKGHRKDVNSLSVHSSGALALSCSRDGTLCMWDLVKGRSTFTTKLDSEADGVKFAPGGATYALMCGSQVTLHAVGGAQGLVGELPHPRRVLCMEFSEDGSHLLTGAEDGSLRAWSSSSDGVIKLWKLSSSPVVEHAASAASINAACIAEAATSARLTTLCAVDPPAVIAQRLKESRGQQQQQQQLASGARSGVRAVAASGAGSSGKAPQAAAAQVAPAARAAGERDRAAAKRNKRRGPAEQPQEEHKGLRESSRNLEAQPEPQLEQGRREQEPADRRDRPLKRVKTAAPAKGSGPAQGSPGGAAVGIVQPVGKAGKTQPPEPQGTAHNGVVDFMDGKDWQKARQKLKKSKKKQQQQQAQGKQGQRAKGKQHPPQSGILGQAPKRSSQMATQGYS
ncbi:hypothetical protein N2152v2_001650 [Parachlorella kessleri]